MTSTATGAGYAAELDAAHDRATPDGAGQAVLIGPGGYAYASPFRLAAADAWVDARTGALRTGSTTAVPDRSLARLGIGGLRLTGPAAADPVAGAPALLRHQLLLAHARLLGAVVEHAITDLDTRTAEGKPLLNRQLVQAAIADTHLVVSQARGQLDVGAAVDPAVCAAVFGRLLRGGRVLLRLLGAAGFLADGPGGALLAAEVVGTLYLTGGSES
ncbi:hypothetical protein [Amycolatopsis sp. PS_44_ISF1]|uniref:hypothetical protein n=1 Tax=Amycolatopsis sp. PS_44_ISF1 TaxID=2974917 RepID=UPI0028DF2FD6|nr:hypothetical protein [Amycolatopsis sp. PS_44_ISF1]MDT8912950.1 hypothetical protein [Amycolatopsis sp. PS_44_ISF1]